MSDKNQISRDELKAAIKEWLLAHPNQPEYIKAALLGYIDLIDNLDTKSAKLKSLLAELRKALGIVPNSERQRSGTNKKRQSRSRLARFKEEYEQLLIRARYYERMGKRHRRKSKEIEAKMLELEQIELTEEEEQEIERDIELFDKQLHQAESRRTDLCCVQPAESFMEGSRVEVAEEEVICPVEDQSKINRSFFEERDRIDFSFKITNYHLRVEKAEIDGPDGPMLISGSTQKIGPPKMKVTWNFLANLAIMVSQYAMPLNRFAGLVSSPIKEFDSSETTRYFQYVAKRLLPIYLHLAQELANAKIWSGDDTKGRVIEVSKALLAGTRPWQAYSNKKKARKSQQSDIQTEKNPLGIEIAKVLGFESTTKNGNTPKKSFSTSVVTGRTDEFDPKSQIIFFRSHMGDLGNLLDALLELRDPKNKKLVIQADLANVNLISKKGAWNIDYAGCISHARRRFVKHKKDDAFGESMVHHFGALYFHEESLKTVGRNVENTLAVRSSTSKRIWDYILEDCHEIAKKWSRETGLGDAARYVIRHFKTLTYYLKDPKIEPSNDFCERMLRMEKLIQANALFRNSLEGRFALDIVRTVLQTAIAAKSDLPAYLNWVLKADPEEVQKNPGKFTPLAYSKYIGSATFN